MEFNVEVQWNEEGSSIQRARFNGSMMDSRMLKKNQPFKELKYSYVIFICQHDKFGESKPIYHVDKVVRETGNPYDDGAYTIYANGLYNGDDDFGKLAYDFDCKKADDIDYKPLAEAVRLFKETEEGRDIMCELFSRLAGKVGDEGAEQSRIDTMVENIRLLMGSMQLTLD